MKLLRFLTLVLSVAVVGSISGCVDKCKDQYCLNGGDCFEGDCECPTGYYGTHCEYSNGGGGGGGGGSNYGTLMFWSNQYGDVINVNVTGYSGSITSYYSSAPSCGSSGCYSIDLSYGSYSYSASDGTHNWNGSVTVSASCNTVLLYW
jgi:hypothetical protein